MRVQIAASMVLALVITATPAHAQAQITTGVIQGLVRDSTGAVVPGVTVEANNVETNLTQTRVTATDGRFVFLQLPPGRYKVTFTLAGFGTVVQDGIVLTVGPGTRRRRDHVRRPARHLQQHQPRWRRLQQRVLRRAGGRPARGHRHHAGGGQGVPGDRERGAGRVRPHGRRRGQRHHEVGHEHPHGSLFHFQRLEALTAELSDGTTLDGLPSRAVRRHHGRSAQARQGVLLFALEGITGDFTRPNLGRPIGTPVPGGRTNAGANEALINGSADCQRLALLNLLPDAARHGRGAADRASGRDGGAAAQAGSRSTPRPTAWRSPTTSTTRARRTRPSTWRPTARRPTASKATRADQRDQRQPVHDAVVEQAQRVPRHLFARNPAAHARMRRTAAADTGMGFSPTFRFGNPFFLQPTVDELIWRTQIKDNLSIVGGTHTFKVGGEWMHTLNDQVFRGFFTGRYLFDSVTGFLRYASPAAPGGFGPSDGRLLERRLRHRADAVSRRARRPTAGRCSSTSRAPGGPAWRPTPRAPRRSPTRSSRCSCRTSGSASNLTLNYGLRWDAQLMPETVDPRHDGVRVVPERSAFPSDGTIPDQWEDVPAARRHSRGTSAGDGKSVVRASAGVYSARQNMLSQVGSVTTNGVQQQTIFVDTAIVRRSARRRRCGRVC